MEKSEIYAIESREQFKEDIEVYHTEGCFLYDGVEYSSSGANDIENPDNWCITQVAKFEETHMISDDIDYLLDNYVMHDGKILGDVIHLAEYC